MNEAVLADLRALRGTVTVLGAGTKAVVIGRGAGVTIRGTPQ